MATATTTLDINVRLGNAEQQVRRLTASLEKLEREGRQASGGFSRSTANIAKGAIIATGAIIALRTAIRTIGSAVNTFRNFESSISNLSAITGAVGDDLDFLSDSARELGKTTTLSASQVAIAFKLVASAKPDLLESGEALKQVTKDAILLSEAAGIDLPTAADALGNALNQFSAGAEQASRFVNTLAAGSKFGASSIADLAASLTDAGVVAKGANVSFEETVAALEVLGSSGIKAQRAGVGLRNVILKLQKEGIDKFNPAVVGLNVALQNLQNAQLPATEVMRIFGLETAVAASSLISGAQSAATLTQKVTGTSTAVDQARTNVDNLDGSILELKSAYEELEIVIGEKFSPTLRAATIAITEFLLGITTSGVELAKRRVAELGIEIDALTRRSERFSGLQGAAIERSLKTKREELALNQKIIDADIAQEREKQTIALTKQAAKQKELVESNRQMALVQEEVAKATFAKSRADAEALFLENERLDAATKLLAIFRQYETPLERLTAQQKLLNAAVEEGSITMEQYDITMGRVNKSIEEYKEKAEKAAAQTTMFQTIAQDFATGAADAFIDFATGSKDAFEDFAKSFLKQIAKMIIQAQLLAAFESFFPSLAGTGTGASTSLMATPIAKGAAFSGGNIIPFARGGVVSKPTLFPMARGAGLMGEAGPEAVLPLTRGKGGKLGVQGSGGGVVVNIINNSDSEITEQVSEDGARIDIIIESVMHGAIAGGKFDRTFNSNFGISRSGF